MDTFGESSTICKARQHPAAPNGESIHIV
jgi:hypothetical protein